MKSGLRRTSIPVCWRALVGTVLCAVDGGEVSIVAVAAEADFRKVLRLEKSSLIHYPCLGINRGGQQLAPGSGFILRVVRVPVWLPRSLNSPPVSLLGLAHVARGAICC